VKEIVFIRRFERDLRRLKKKLPTGSLDYETLEYLFELLQRGDSLDGVPRPRSTRFVIQGYSNLHRQGRTVIDHASGRP
jgi:hypothetical protein